ncbi:hypothetical protein C8J57DRAFT_1515280 [Mycena rebaudengoi]|jgi:hypothetical protein|nr:hypothetical protein C8J57DRAFT_1515280 [Mycena rebaudengoi]
MNLVSTLTPEEYQAALTVAMRKCAMLREEKRALQNIIQHAQDHGPSSVRTGSGRAVNLRNIRFASFILDARIQQEMVISPPISESRSPLSLPLLMAEFQILEDQISHVEALTLGLGAAVETFGQEE